jgi:hypothetical protein
VSDDSDPVTLEERLGATTFDGERAALELLVDEARRTLDEQLDNSDDIDDKAVRILRVDVLLLGLVATAVSLLVQSEAFALGPAVNPYTVLGTLAIVGSTAAAAVTLSVSSFRVGVGGWNVLRTLEDDATERQLYLVLSRSYGAWIAQNRDSEVRNTLWITLTTFSLVSGLLLLSVGVYSIVRQVEVRMALGTLMTLLLIGGGLGLPAQVHRYLETLRAA